MRNHLLKTLSIACIFYLLSGCSGDENSTIGNGNAAISDTVLTATYPNLYQAVFSRDDEALFTFINHTSPQIRRQAWRSLAQTPVDSLAGFIKKVKQDSSANAWFALSMHEIAAEQLRDLETYWLNQPFQRAGISLVLGQQGDEQTLAFLIDNLNKISGKEYEPEGALAISRLIIRFQGNESQQFKIINAAFATGDAEITQRWLYGFYRGDSEMLNEAMKDSLTQKWQSFGIGTDVNVDQYIAKILGSPVFSDIVERYNAFGKLSEEVQLGIELAKLAGKLEITDENFKNLKILLVHPNLHVVHQTLANLEGNIESGDTLHTYLNSAIVEDETAENFVWLQALATMSGEDATGIQDHADRLNKISEDQPYLFPQVLNLWMKSENDEAFLNRIEQTVTQGDPLKSMYAVNALSSFWSEAENKNTIKPRLRDIIFDALSLGDRGVTFSTQSLLQDDELFAQNDFTRINEYLNGFTLPGDIEVYQSFGSLYKERFEEQARPVIDSLAALGYVPLNRSLNQAGWEVEVPDDVDTEFRTPDWNRLWELGEHPVWVLETEKGTIKIRMNTLSAPATVSVIDSLTQSGAYNGVPFHRVVPNFVIQGGDIERRDGFGGPDFTIPTEASGQGFTRGAAGIASAGADTEGSQYFFMHQWSPHLNGRYTLFGNIITGMDVVDRIIVGDIVEKAYWE